MMSKESKESVVLAVLRLVNTANQKMSFAQNVRTPFTVSTGGTEILMTRRPLMKPDDQMTVEDIARKWHELYEHLAPEFGYTTRSDTREFDPSSSNAA